MPSSAPASVGPSVPDLCAERCSSCHKFCPLDLSYCCQTCARHWCIECLAAHLRLYAGFKPRSQPGSLHWPPGPAPVPCLGRPLGCSSNIPPDLVRSFQAEPLPANELSPSSSICSVETTMLHLPQVRARVLLVRSLTCSLLGVSAAACMGMRAHLKPSGWHCRKA